MGHAAPLALAALCVSAAGLALAVAAAAAPHWLSRATLGAYLVQDEVFSEGLWQTCVERALLGHRQCSEYFTLLAAPGALQPARALLPPAVLLALLGVAVAAPPACCRCRAPRLLLAGGCALGLSGALCLAAVGFVCARVVRDFFDPFVPEPQKPELGSSIYVGWAASAALLCGCALLLCSAYAQQEQQQQEDEAHERDPTAPSNARWQQRVSYI
ncbi:claudin-4-like [Lampetra fluviatilis]